MVLVTSMDISSYDLHITTVAHQIPSDKRHACVFTTFMCVYVCDMWGSFKHGALGRKPSCSGLRGVLTKEVYEFQSHWIFFRGLWEAHPCCTKSFHRWPVETGTNVTPRHPGRKVQEGLLPDGLGGGKGSGCRHGWEQGWGKSYLKVQRLMRRFLQEQTFN